MPVVCQRLVIIPELARSPMIQDLMGFGPPADGVIGAGSALGVVEFPLPPRGMLFCVGGLEAICWVVGDPKALVINIIPWQSHTCAHNRIFGDY